MDTNMFNTFVTTRYKSFITIWILNTNNNLFIWKNVKYKYIYFLLIENWHNSVYVYIYSFLLLFIYYLYRIWNIKDILIYKHKINNKLYFIWNHNAVSVPLSNVTIHAHSYITEVLWIDCTQNVQFSNFWLLKKKKKKSDATHSYKL